MVGKGADLGRIGRQDRYGLVLIRLGIPLLVLNDDLAFLLQHGMHTELVRDDNPSVVLMLLGVVYIIRVFAECREWLFARVRTAVADRQGHADTEAARVFSLVLLMSDCRSRSSGVMVPRGDGVVVMVRWLAAKVVKGHGGLRVEHVAGSGAMVGKGLRSRRQDVRVGAWREEPHIMWAELHVRSEPG